VESLFVDVVVISSHCLLNSLPLIYLVRALSGSDWKLAVSKTPRGVKDMSGAEY